MRFLTAFLIHPLGDLPVGRITFAFPFITFGCLGVVKRVEERRKNDWRTGFLGGCSLLGWPVFGGAKKGCFPALATALVA